MQKLKNAVKSINTEHIDVMAEAVIADLLEQKIDINDIEVVYDGAFERNYKKDLIDMSVDMVGKVISLHISRNGLYDNLPEGLFHTITSYSRVEGDDRKNEFKKQKQEEEKARKFFNPFDKEFFFQKVKLEIETRKLLENPFTEIEKWFPNESKIPQKYFRRLVNYLPFTSKIKGDLELTAQCLSEIIEENVKTKRFYSTGTIFPSSANEQNKLGTKFLGENFICGNGLNEDVLTWEFTVVVNDEKMLDRYFDVDKGFMKNLMNKFYRFFIPFEINTRTKVICNMQNAFYLGEGDEQDKSRIEHTINDIYLGYNTML